MSEDIRQMNTMLNTHWPDNNTEHIDTHDTHTTGDEAARAPAIVQGCINEQGSVDNSARSDVGNSLVMSEDITDECHA